MEEIKIVRKFEIYIDGASRGNPGPASYGFVILDADKEILVKKGAFIGKATNNVAEYKALLGALNFAQQLQAQELAIKSDSLLLVNQLNGTYRVKSEALIPLFEKAIQTLKHFDRFTIIHIPRTQNKEADKLANKALNIKSEVYE